MEMIPTEQEVIALLKETGALRAGHFEYPNGLHSDQYLQVPIAMRHFETAKLLSVGLSRKIRANPELRAMICNLSVVAPATGGLPVAYGVSEALRAKQVYWAESEDPGGPQKFRPFIHPQPGEQVLLVDDILRSGRKLTELKQLIESYGAEVVALAVVVYQPNPETLHFGDLPFYYLAKLDAMYYYEKTALSSTKLTGPAERIWV
jgi:orotate phosphoribosyltransferase